MFSPLLLVTIGLAQKLKPPTNSPSICYNPPCTMKAIHAQIYVDDELWEKTRKMVKRKPTGMVMFQLRKMFKAINKLLANLDDGGFNIIFKKEDVFKLSESRLKFKDTHAGRLDMNQANNSIFVHFLKFQEAVQRLPNRNATDLRILVRDYKKADHKRSLGEESCVCDFLGFACVAVFSVETPLRWWKHKSHFAHALGHTLGAVKHDDDNYEANKVLIMMKSVGSNASLWSPHTKLGINSQDHSCLRERHEKGKDFNVGNNTSVANIVGNKTLVTN